MKTITIIEKNEKDILVKIGNSNHRLNTKDGGNNYDFELHGLAKEYINKIREKEIEFLKLNKLKTSINKRLSKEELDLFELEIIVK